MTTPQADRLAIHASMLDSTGKHAAADVVGMHSHVHGEQFTGNGILTQYTLAHTPLYGVSAFVAGLRVEVTLSGAVVTFIVAPALAALIRINYEW